MEHVTEIFKDSLLYAMRPCFLMLNCSAEAESAVFGNTLMTAQRGYRWGNNLCMPEMYGRLSRTEVNVLFG